MHELALADAIVQTASENARGGRVVVVEVRVGRLRQVVPDALSFAFELVAQGTPVEGAELLLEEVPVLVSCTRCGAKTEIEALPLACASCGCVETEVVTGEELEVEAIEIASSAGSVAGKAGDTRQEDRDAYGVPGAMVGAGRR